MKKYSILIFILIGILFLVNLTSCKKNKDNKIEQKELVGYFYIYHIGEENKPVPYFIVKTNGDTTYRQVKKNWEEMNELSIDFNMIELRDINIENCDTSAFSQFKNILYNYDKNNRTESNYDYGSFEIKLVDNFDTLTFVLYRSEYTKFLFEDLEKIAQKDQLEKASNRFRFYQNMQP